VWRLPKGHLDDDMTGKNPGPLTLGKKRATEEQIREAALREVKEEGGVLANIMKKIVTDKFFFILKGEKVLKFVTYYLMEWIKDLSEGPGFETSEVAWLPFKKARERLSYSGEKKIGIRYDDHSLCGNQHSSQCCSEFAVCLACWQSFSWRRKSQVQ